MRKKRERLKGLARGITAPLWPGQRGPEEKPDCREVQKLALSAGLDASRPGKPGDRDTTVRRVQFVAVEIALALDDGKLATLIARKISVVIGFQLFENILFTW